MPEQIERLVDSVKNRLETTDEVKVNVMKALCWLDQTDQAKYLIPSLNEPYALPTREKVFLRDVFNINYLKQSEE
jgi:hypothetical protein